MNAPILLWHRRDLRLSDNPAMHWASQQGRPVIPFYLLDEIVEEWGAAPRWRLGLGLEAFGASLKRAQSQLVLRQGPALDAIRTLIKETGADTVVWNRLYVADERARDTAIKEALRAEGLTANSFAAHVLFEPWTVETGTGGYYRVYTPFWKSVRDRALDAPLPAINTLIAPQTWPASDNLADWGLALPMRRGADVVANHVVVGEAAAAERLETFMNQGVGAYAAARDQMAVDGTSGLSENLTYGEISARTCWHAGWRAHHEGEDGAETFLKELVWRDFAHHLGYHTPHLTTENWKPVWDNFPWREDNADAEAWRRGRTGVEIVDAAMRELYVTGRMHNRARMLVASYLTKHLMTHWKVGLEHFAECLVDWDPASNAMGWQWTAGSGPDASPFFRVFNPETQAEKFDKQGRYRRRWLAERGGRPLDPQGEPVSDAMAFFDAIPASWEMASTDRYPEAPIVGLKEGRDRALAAYSDRPKE